MSDLEKIINFIKWQILARMPHGSITKRIILGNRFHEEIDKNDPFYYIYWQDIKKSDLEKYLLGTFCTRNEDYLEFINWLNQNFACGNFYKINTGESIITIPIPSPIDYKCFKAEFLDIIMSELTIHVSRPIPFLEGPYEYGDVKINAQDNVLDIGANYGLFSSLASSKGANVYAFEPTPRVLDSYLRPLEQENANIHVIPRAVTDKTGKALFHIDNNNTSCNKVVTDNPENGCALIVNTTSVDDFVDFTHLTHVDFIKADIEGAERLMLEGAQYTLKEFAPNLSICTYHLLDDKKVLTDLILSANPDYEITYAYKKLYARTRKKR